MRGAFAPHCADVVWATQAVDEAILFLANQLGSSVTAKKLFFPLANRLGSFVS
jgi:hypothetical protein